MDEIIRQLKELWKKFEKHDQDLYHGNGKPGLTVRMELAEKEIFDMKEDIKEHRRDSKQIKMMLLGAIVAGVIDSILKLVK